MVSLPSSQGGNDGNRIGQGDLPVHGRPDRERRPLEAKEEEDAVKEAFDGGVLAQFFLGPGRWQAGAVRAARLGLQGTTAIAPSVAWIQWIRCSPQ